MTSKVLKSNGQVIYTSTLRPLNEAELLCPDELKARNAYDDCIREKLGGPADRADAGDPNQTPDYELYEDDFEGTRSHADDSEPPTPEAGDAYIGAEVNLPLEGTLRAGKVKRRARDDEGEVFGSSNSNPILDTRVYEVEFPDGRTAAFAANVIAENMYTHCDPDGSQHLLLGALVDYRSDGNAIAFADRFVTICGKQHIKRSTAGWQLCVEWKDGSTSWERLSDLKESYPEQVAEYAIAQGIEHEPAFSWWVPYTMKKRDRIIKAVNSRYLKHTHKFGFEIPKTSKRALEIDRESGNTLWQVQSPPRWHRFGLNSKHLTTRKKSHQVSPTWIAI